MTQKFVTAFLTTCFEAGLSKEAAAQLLQRESLDQQLEARPAFAAGYLSKVASFPGQMRPVLFLLPETELEKSAGPGMRGLGRVAKALLWDAPKGVGEAAYGGIKTGLKGLGNVVGPRSNSLLNRHPFAVGIPLATATGLGGYGLSKWLGGDNSLNGGGDPFLPPGGYNKAEYEKMYEGRLKEHEPGIFSANAEYDSAAGRLAELNKAIEENRGGNNAYQDKLHLERRRNQLSGARTEYANQLDRNQDDQRALMDRIANRKADLENQRTAWWAAPKRWYQQARGGNVFDSGISQRAFDRQIGGLQDSSARAAMAARMAADRARLVRGGATGRAAPRRDPAQLSTDFFPAYK
jgi:hypothetical protein